jgi:uncharacterized protein YxeA
MKKYLLPILAILILLLTANVLAAMAQRPDYEKYGRIATAVIKEDYPGEELKDYLYAGRKQKSNDEVVDSFQFKVNENGKPIVATVLITHNLKNNKLLTLAVTEEPGR